MLVSLYGVKRIYCIQRLAFRGLSIDMTSIDIKILRPLQLWVPLIANILLVLAMIKYVSENIDDLEKIAEALAPILQYSLCIAKVLIFLYKRKDMAKLLHNIWMMTLEANTAELQIVADENAMDYIFSLSYYISVAVLGTLSLIVPLITTVVIYVKTEELKFFQTFKGSYLFDQNQPFNYFVIYCIVLGSVYFAGHAAVSIDTLYSWLVLNIAAQFRILNLKLKNAAKTESHSTAMEYDIQRCIERHQQIINIANEFNMVFRTIIFAEFFVNGLQLCFLAYQFASGTTTKVENLPFLIAFFTAVSVQLIMYCYGGQRMQDESEIISTFIYEHFQWHSISCHCKKLLLVSMLRAQKCCELTGYFFTANWKLFIWVVQTNFSYISLLWTLDENQTD